jgi:importin subunit beta-1
MNMIQLLTNAAGADPNLRQQAQQILNQSESSQTGQYLAALVDVMINAQNNVQLRQLAGLNLKNALDARTTRGQAAKDQRYLSVPPANRQTIKAQLLQILVQQGQPQQVRRAAALAVAKIGTIEIPANQWPDLLNTLSGNARNPQVQDDGVKATLECIGYLCEELDEDVVPPASVNEILTAIVHSMREEASLPVRLAATKALDLSLSFTGSNMASENEANMIVSQICTAAQCGLDDNGMVVQDPSGVACKVRQSAFECMVRMVSCFYERIQPYMQTFFQLTIGAITNDAANVSLQAIEFWSTVCDEEYELANGDEPGKCQNYVAGAVGNLIPLLLEKMTSVEEDDDEDEFTPAKAACACVSLIATLVEDIILQHVMPIIQQWIGDQQVWQRRDAATYAFGAVMEGCSTQALGPMIQNALGTLLQLVEQDPMQPVQDTALWVVAQICDHHFSAIPANEQTYDGLIKVVLEAMSKNETMASHACLAFHSIAKSQEAMADNGSNVLSRYFQPVVEALLTVSNSNNGEEGNNLRLESHEALNEWLTNGAQDTQQALEKVTLEVISRLEQTVGMADSPTKASAQEALTGSLQIALRKLDQRGTVVCDRVMTVALRVLDSTVPTAEAETFLLISQVANLVEGGFTKYLDQTFPKVIKGLKNTDDFHTCSIVVGLVGDLTRAIGPGLSEQHCDAIVQELLAALRNPSLDQSVKAPVIGAFGDVAIALDDRFVRYFQPVMSILNEASGATYDMAEADEDDVDFFCELRNSLFDTYMAILSGLSVTNKFEPFIPYLFNILKFIVLVANDPNMDDTAFVNAGMFIGDLIDSFGRTNQEFVKAFKDPALLSGLNTIHQKIQNASDVDKDNLDAATYGMQAAMNLSKQ